MLRREVESVDRNVDIPNPQHLVDKCNYISVLSRLQVIPHDKPASTVHQVTPIHLDEANVTLRTLTVNKGT